MDNRKRRSIGKMSLSLSLLRLDLLHEFTASADRAARMRTSFRRPHPTAAQRTMIVAKIYQARRSPGPLRRPVALSITDALAAGRGDSPDAGLTARARGGDS